MVVIAHEVTVGVARADLFENPFFAGLGDARRGDPDRRRRETGRGGGGRGLPGAETRDGVAVVFGVFEFAVDRGDPSAGERGVELLEAAHDDDDLGRSRWRGRRGRHRKRGETRRCGMKLPTRGFGGALLESGDRFAAESVELADGEHHRALEVVDQFAEGKRRTAESAELVAQALGGKRLIFGGGERERGIGLGDVAVRVAGDQRERRADMAVKLERDRTLETNFFAFERGA